MFVQIIAITTSLVLSAQSLADELKISSTHNYEVSKQQENPRPENGGLFAFNRKFSPGESLLIEWDAFNKAPLKETPLQFLLEYYIEFPNMTASERSNYITQTLHQIKDERIEVYVRDKEGRITKGLGGDIKSILLLNPYDSLILLDLLLASYLRSGSSKNSEVGELFSAIGPRVQKDISKQNPLNKIPLQIRLLSHYVSRFSENLEETLSKLPTEGESRFSFESQLKSTLEFYKPIQASLAEGQTLAGSSQVLFRGNQAPKARNCSLLFAVL